MAKTHQTRTVQIAKISIGLMLLGLLIPMLLPDILPKIDEDSARTFVEWFGYRRALLLPILVMLLTAFVFLSFRYIDLHNDNFPTDKKSDGELRSERERILNNLSNDEKALLRLYIVEHKTKTLKFHMGNTSVASLMQQYILTPSSSYSIDLGSNYILIDWAWKILNNKPQLLN